VSGPTPAHLAIADGEHKVSGENACRALFMTRPDDIRRVYVTDDVLPRFKDVLKFCAERRIAYHVKDDADLDQIAETVHHDGVLFLARRQREASVDDVVAWADRLRPEQRSVIVLLEGVKNPHNLGAILRVCAHFGVPWVLRTGSTPPLSPAAMRTAEGGAEHSMIVGTDGEQALDGALDALVRRGFALVATSSHATLALGRESLPPRAIVMFGSEGEGLSERLMRRATDVIAIPGSGALESLNVACAASVVLWELWRGATPATATASSKPTAKSAPSWSPAASATSSSSSSSTAWPSRGPVTPATNGLSPGPASRGAARGHTTGRRGEAQD
jgi:TrmH RNA methyltransferase